MQMVKTNREYKSSMLIELLNEKEYLLEFYGAIRNKTYSKDTEVLITTLEGTLFMEQMNDISFVIEDRVVVLIEHQSTINNNMPLRGLIYIARIYEMLVEEESVYKEKLIPLPKPEIIVLYNGEKEMPEQQELRLSNAFKDFEDGEVPCLDCVVKVYNINKGRNEELAARSSTLKGYEIFVSLVREYAKSMDRSSAIVKAIDDCIRQNVLRDFLKRNASEVRNMLFTKWDWNVAKRVWQEESKTEGLLEGRLEGRQEGLLQAARQMKAKGFGVSVISEITGLPKEDIERL